MELVDAAYAIARLLPHAECHSLAEQIRRAAVSIPASIAEGHARVHKREFLQYLAIARASAAELETHLLITLRVGYVKSEQLHQPLALSDEVSRIFTAMRARLADGPSDDARRSALGAQQTARKNSSQSRIP